MPCHHFHRAGVRHLLRFGAALAMTVIAATVYAQEPRLRLMLTGTIDDGGGSQCVAESTPSAAALAHATLVITERDVVAWNPVGARWQLDPARFSETGSGNPLSGHCFVLSIDGKPVSNGLVLSVNTSQLTGYPTLNVITEGEALTLQLTSGNHHHISLLHAAQLEDVFGNPANLAQQLGRIQGYDYDGAGRRWSEAVRQLIERKAIRPGMPVGEVLMLLGPPSSTTVTEQGTSYQWYFNTPMHVNPLFMLQTQSETVSAYRFDRR